MITRCCTSTGSKLHAPIHIFIKLKAKPCIILLQNTTGSVLWQYNVVSPSFYALWYRIYANTEMKHFQSFKLFLRCTCLVWSFLSANHSSSFWYSTEYFCRWLFFKNTSSINDVLPLFSRHASQKRQNTLFYVVYAHKTWVFSHSGLSFKSMWYSHTRISTVCVFLYCRIIELVAAAFLV